MDDVWVDVTAACPRSRLIILLFDFHQPSVVCVGIKNEKCSIFSNC